MDAVKSFLEIDEVDYQECLEFKALFNYSPQGKDLFTAGSSLPEVSLFFSQPAVNMFSKSLIGNVYWFHSCHNRCAALFCIE